MVIHPDPHAIRLVIRHHKRALESCSEGAERIRREAAISELTAEHVRLTGNADMSTPFAWRDDQ